MFMGRTWSSFQTRDSQSAVWICAVEHKHLASELPPSSFRVPLLAATTAVLTAPAPHQTTLGRASYMIPCAYTVTVVALPLILGSDSWT